MGYEKRKRTIVSTDVSAKRCFWRIAWCHVERAEVEFQPNVHGRNLGFQWIIPNVALENSDLTASSCRRLFHPSLKVISTALLLLGSTQAPQRTWTDVLRSSIFLNLIFSSWHVIIFQFLKLIFIFLLLLYVSSYTTASLSFYVTL